jgi:Cdc6-like AAA superfamily ATPase
MSNSPKKRNKKIIEEEEESQIDDFSKLVPFSENLNLIANEELSTSINYTPERIDILEKLTDSQIYCRDKEREYILNFLQNEEEVKSLFICGQPGTGKTSLMNEIFKSHLTTNKFCFKIYINCMSLNSIKDFNEEIFKFFNKTSSLTILRKIFKSKKYDSLIKVLKTNQNNIKTETLCNLLNILNTNDVGEKLTPIILLDEIDHFYQKNDDIAFFDILSIPYLSSCDLKIIMISNNSEFDKYILPKIENRKIKISKYVFKPYTHVEINKILIQKLSEINFKENFEENAVRFISSKLANKSGDIRPAIEIIKSIILNQKEEFSKGKKVDLREVMIILKHKASSFSEILKNLTFEQKVVISSIYFTMINTESSIITEEQVKKFVHFKFLYFLDP